MNILISDFSSYISKNLINKLNNTKHKTFVLEKNLNVAALVDLIKLSKIDCIVSYSEFIKDKDDNLIERLLEAGKVSHIKLFVELSALGVGENIKTKYFEKMKMEEELVKTSGTPFTIIRPSEIFSKGDKSISKYISNMKTVHLFPILGGGKYLIQPLHIDDLTNLIVNVLDNPKYEGRVVEIAGPKVYMFKEMIKVLKNRTKTKALLINIPMFLVRFIAKLGDRVSVGIDSDRLTMLVKGNYLRRRKNNSIIQITGTLGLEDL